MLTNRDNPLAAWLAVPLNSVRSWGLKSWSSLGSALLAWPWELAALLIVALRLYWQTMPPGLSSWIVKGWDSAMLQVVGSTWGVPHSPGYPLYTLLANFFVRLLSLIPGAAATGMAWRVSFWSTVTSLLTLILVYLIVRRLTGWRAAALVAAGLLGVSFIFWRGAIMAEVYSLNALLFALTYWLALRWAERPTAIWLILLGLAVGAGLAHHRTAFMLPPTVAGWICLHTLWPSSPSAQDTAENRWSTLLRRWLLVGGVAALPLLTYLYLPWAARYRQGQTWLYGNTADWNTFWFVVLSREWWGLVQPPQSLAQWGTALETLFWMQAEQLTAWGVVAGLGGLLLAGRRLWLFGPPLLALIFFGFSYKVADLDSMLIPLSLTLCVGVGLLLGRLGAGILTAARRLAPAGWPLRRTTLVGRGLLSLGMVGGAYLFLAPLAQANYERVDLSGDWQAEDLVEEVVAIAQAGTPLTIIGQDNSVLPDFIYAAVVLDQPIEPLSTTTLSRMPPEESRAIVQRRLAAGRRVLVDAETLDLGFLPWLAAALESGQLFLAPTGHPVLWELLPRPMSATVPAEEPWRRLEPGQFLDGQLSVVAVHQRIIHKRTGCFLRLTLLWQAPTFLEQDYAVAVQPVHNPASLAKNDHLALMRNYLPTSQLFPGEVVRDEIDLLIRDPALLPGEALRVIVYQVQGDQFPTFGQIDLPVTVEPAACGPSWS